MEERGELDAGEYMSTRLTLENGRILGFDTLYSTLGITARSGLAERLGAAMNEDGRLVVDRHRCSSIPGFYAAGYVVSTLNQIAVAMGEAAMAATAIHNFCGIGTEWPAGWGGRRPDSAVNEPPVRRGSAGR